MPCTGTLLYMLKLLAGWCGRVSLNRARTRTMIGQNMRRGGGVVFPMYQLRWAGSSWTNTQISVLISHHQHFKSIASNSDGGLQPTDVRWPPPYHPPMSRFVCSSTAVRMSCVEFRSTTLVVFRVHFRGIALKPFVLLEGTMLEGWLPSAQT